MSEVARLRRIRRYAVPRWMIERSAERRAAGDWRGACAAAAIDVELDLDEIARRRDAEVAGRVEDDLRHLVPDLVRWHAPRVQGRTTLAPDHPLVLAEYGMEALYVDTPSWLINGPQRMTLRFGDPRPREAPFICTDFPHIGFWRNLVQPWTEARHLWDDRHTGELRERCGGDAGRAPFFHPDGTPLTAAELPASDPGPGDPAGHTEWVTLLHERGEIDAAFAAAGVELVTPDPGTGRPGGYEPFGPYDQLARMPLALTRLEPEIRRLGGGRFQIPWTVESVILFDHDGERLRVEVVASDSYWEWRDEHGKDVPVLADATWRRPPDLDLLRHGRTPPEALHPLVRDALFPGRAAARNAPAGPPEPEVPLTVRVRCGGEWHEPAFRDGVLEIPHTGQERDREAALVALGGEPGGCFAAERAWTTGRGRLPRKWRELRRDLFDRFHHGDTDGVVRMLDLGIDPRVRDEHGRTLLHMLALLPEHEPLLPRLLAAGLDLEAESTSDWSRDMPRTPLHRAVEMDGREALVRALVDAGARVDLLDEEETTLLRLIDRAGRRDLGWLRERVLAEHPDYEDY
ncbi:ankyrin repeat domain-containing protein [Spirillospora sp. NPDC029432]|uniref:ankyrin repeat domain-containing protein n=1 Tax=Spirillospora sp. NPDC029432 TaxID=3154599 RepID=UPI00345324D5